MNMSLPTLYRKIKQYSDLSILELTRNIRLKKAAELLACQQYSVQEVAEMVGFNDTATFRKRFTEQYGVTPSQYGAPTFAMLKDYNPNNSISYSVKVVKNHYIDEFINLLI